MERKPVTLCYWVTDLVGIRVATDIKCHPRIAPIGQRSKNRGLGERFSGTFLGWSTWSCRSPEANLGRIRTGSRRERVSDFTEAPKPKCGRWRWWVLQNLSRPPVAGCVHRQCLLPLHTTYQQALWGTGFALGSKKWWTPSLLCCAWLLKRWGGRSWWEHEIQKWCRCAGYCSKHAAYSYSFNPHNHPLRVGTIIPILKVE